MTQVRGARVRAIPSFRSTLMRHRGWVARCSAGGLDQNHLLVLVDFPKLDFDDFLLGGLHMPADKGRLDRQLPMSAVDKHGQPDSLRAAMVEKRIERGTHRSPGVENVIHQNDIASPTSKPIAPGLTTGRTSRVERSSR